MLLERRRDAGRPLGQRDVVLARSTPRPECAARSRARSPGTRRAWCGRRRRRSRPSGAASSRTESRMLVVFADPREPLGAAAAVAEQPLEHEPRMVLGEVRRRLVAPRHRVHVEAVAGVARALRRGVDRELERAHGRGLAEHVGRELVGAGRELHLDAGPRAVPRVHAREPGGRGARVVARAVAEVLGLLVVETAHDRELLCAAARAARARATGRSSVPSPVGLKVLCTMPLPT